MPGAGRSGPDGIVLRPLVPGDVAAVHAVVRASERHDRVPIVTTLELLEAELTLHPVDPPTDARVAVIDGEVVGHIVAYHLPSDVREERSYLFGGVHPDHRRRGIGTALMKWGIARATGQLRSSGRSLPRYIRVDRLDHITDAHDLYRSLGMATVRFHEELLRPLTDLPHVAVPEGVRLVPWDPRRSEEIRVMKNLAFEDHWGSTPTSVESWHELTEGPGARLDLSTLAVTADRVVGMCLVHRYPDDDELLGRRDAWIDKLATLREWRARGIASALVAHSLHRFRDDGLTHASIGVDSANPTGAARLYRALGFVSEHRSTTWQLTV